MKTIWIFVLLIPLFGFSQEQCGSSLPDNTDTIVEAQFYKPSTFFDSVYASNYQQAILAKTNTGGIRTAIWMIPVRIWIIKNTNGQAAITEEDAFQYIKKINIIYANNNTGIQFFAKCDVLYHTDNGYYTNPMDEYINQKQRELRDYGALNIHFIKYKREGGFRTLGTASFPQDDDFFGLTMMADDIEPEGTVLAHEIGHCLGLLHPHQGRTTALNADETSKCWQEAVWRSRLRPFWECFSEAKVCEKNGDRLCDTDASPKLGSSNVFSTGEYFGGGTDLWDNEWTPQTNLVMSYTPYNLGVVFTPQQVGLMQNAIAVLNSTYRIPDYMFRNADIDYFEPDNRKGNARPIALNEMQYHTFNQHINLTEQSFQVYQKTYSDCDEDWITFDNTYGTMPVKIETSAINGKPSPNTEIFLYDASNTLIASNNDIAPNNNFSRVFVQSLPLGQYYIRIINHSSALTYNLTTGANGYHYNISLNYEDGSCFHPYLYGTMTVDNSTGDYNIGATEGGNNIIKSHVNLNISDAACQLNADAPFFWGGGVDRPSVGTTVSVELCPNSIITVENNGLLQLGDGVRYGNLILGNGSTLVIKNGGTLNIRYGSKLTLAGGSLVFEDGAIIQLQDIESVIEIRNGGKIIIGANATFSWTGSGYLKFNSDPTTTFIPNVIASSANNGATFNQVNPGGSHKKVIEVTRGSLAVDKNVSLFKITNGTVFMGTNALVDVKSQMLFSGVKMKPLNGASYTGIRVYGQQEAPYLHTCVIDDAFIGLEVISNGGGSGNAGVKYASVKYTNFNNCYIGVKITGKSAQITGGKYWKNKTGIFLSGAEYTSTISGITAYDNRSAIDVAGTGYDMLEVKNADIYSNVAAGAFMVKSMIRPTCSQINNNYPGSNPFNGCNILLREYATLNVEPYGLNGTDGGKSSIASDKSHSVVCLEAKGLYLHHGKTNFYTDASNNMSFYGTLQPWYMFMIGTPTILAHKNIWNPTGTPIVNGVDYSITNNWGSITIDDANPIKHDEVNCIQPPADWDGKPSQLINPCPKLEGDGDDLIIIDGLAKMYQQTPDYISAISDFAGVVTKSYQTLYVPPVTPPGQDPPTEPAEYLDEFSDCNKIIEFAYQSMLEALGKGIGNGTIENNGEITDPVQTVIDAQNALKDYYIQYENGSRKVFEINLEQALIYRLINDRQTALEKIGQLQGEAETEVEQNLLSYYECLITNEIIIETSEDDLNYSELNDCVTFLNLPDAEFEPTGERPEDPVWEEGFGKRGNEDPGDNKIQPSITKGLANDASTFINVYPNPANNLVNVKLPLGMEASEIRVTDIAGRLVQSYQNDHLTGIIVLDVQLANGTYFIEIINGVQTLACRKIMIAK